MGKEVYGSHGFSWWRRLWSQGRKRRQTVAEKVQSLGQNKMEIIFNEVLNHDRKSWFNPLKWFQHPRISRYRSLCVFHYSLQHLDSDMGKEPLIKDDPNQPLSFIEFFSKHDYGKRWLPRFLANDFFRKSNQFLGKVVEKYKNKAKKEVLQKLNNLRTKIINGCLIQPKEKDHNFSSSRGRLFPSPSTSVEKKSEDALQTDSVCQTAPSLYSNSR